MRIVCAIFVPLIRHSTSRAEVYRHLRSAALADEPPRREFGGGRFRTVDGGFASDPLSKLGQRHLPVGERLEAEVLTCPGEIGPAMPDVTGTVAPGDHRLELVTSEEAGQRRGELVDR